MIFFYPFHPPASSRVSRNQERAVSQQRGILFERLYNIQRILYTKRGQHREQRVWQYKRRREYTAARHTQTCRVVNFKATAHSLYKYTSTHLLLCIVYTHPPPLPLYYTCVHSFIFDNKAAAALRKGRNNNHNNKCLINGGYTTTTEWWKEVSHADDTKSTAWVASSTISRRSNIKSKVFFF